MKLRWRLSHTRGYLQLGMLKEAEAELKAIGSEDAERKDVAGLWMAVLHERESWRRLRTLAAKWVRQDPEEVSWWISYAFAARRISSISRARLILLDSLVHHPEEAVVHFNLACYAAQLGNLEEARTRLHKSIAIDGEFAESAKTDPDLEPLRDADGEKFLPGEK